MSSAALAIFSRHPGYRRTILVHRGRVRIPQIYVVAIARDNDAFIPRRVHLFTAVGLVWAAHWIIAATGYPNLTDNERRVKKRLCRPRVLIVAER